ncbi:MAG: substrate-binding domain-containing protein [Planctomycetota bacterium]|jgi:DNA-binding LacI/PurR family transcriptional regulator
MTNTFKYEDIADKLKNYIASQPAESFLPPMRQLMADYNISQATLERCLRELEHTGLIKRIPRKGIQVSSKKKEKSNLLGVLITNIDSFFDKAFVDAVTKRAAQDNYQIITCSSQNDAERENELICEMAENGVDGFIIRPGKDHRIRRSNFELGRIAAPLQSLPHVLLESETYNEQSLCVNLEYYESARKTTGLILDKGYRNIAFVSSFNTKAEVDIFDGFRAALNSHNLPQDEIETLHLKRGRSNKLTQLEELIAHKPQCIFISYSAYVVLLEEILKKRNIKVPEDILIVSLIDEEYEKSQQIPLIAMEKPATLAGTLCCEKLLKKIDSHKSEDNTVNLDINVKIDKEIEEYFSEAHIGVLSGL